LQKGRRALRGAGPEPERLATRAWGMSGPVRIQEQNRKGSALSITDATDALQYKGHYRTENCTKQEAPPEDERPTIYRVPRCPAILTKSQRPGVFLNILTSTSNRTHAHARTGPETPRAEAHKKPHAKQQHTNAHLFSHPRSPPTLVAARRPRERGD